MKNNLELKEKAFNYVKEKRWDYLLLHTFLAVKHYPYWSKRDDFATNWNIGLDDVSSETKLLACGYKKKETEFVRARFDNIVFETGGFSDSTSMPDGELFVTFACSLILDKKPVLTIYYNQKNTEAYSAKDYDMMSVEELHVDPRIDELLLGVEKLIKEHAKLVNRREAERRNQQYEGKFSFGNEPENPSGSLTEKDSTSEHSGSEGTSYKLGRLVGKFFK
jgi:hypothetical protein